MTFNIYVLNLASSTDRLARVSDLLDRAGVGFQRIEAIDGRGRSATEFPDYDQRKARTRYGRDLLGGEVGCYLSHFKCLETFVQSGAPHGVVFEDDFYFEPENFMEILPETIRWLDTHDPSWTAVNLGGRATKHLFRRATFGGVDLNRAYIFPIVTTGMIWSRAGATAVLNQHSGVGDPVDHHFRNVITRLGGGYAMRPTPVRQSKTASLINSDGPVVVQNNKTRFGRLWTKRRLYTSKIRHQLADRFGR